MHFRNKKYRDWRVRLQEILIRHCEILCILFVYELVHPICIVTLLVQLSSIPLSEI